MISHMIKFRLYYFIFTSSIPAPLYILCGVEEAGPWSPMAFSSYKSVTAVVQRWPTRVEFIASL